MKFCVTCTDLRQVTRTKRNNWIKFFSGFWSTTVHPMLNTHQTFVNYYSTFGFRKEMKNSQRYQTTYMYWNSSQFIQRLRTGYVSYFRCRKLWTLIKSSHNRHRFSNGDELILFCQNVSSRMWLESHAAQTLGAETIGHIFAEHVGRGGVYVHFMYTN